ncbi:MAG: hypothetical protein RIG61_04910 [Deltaproteobacteria bacterium]
MPIRQWRPIPCTLEIVPLYMGKEVKNKGRFFAEFMLSRSNGSKWHLSTAHFMCAQDEGVEKMRF